MCANWGSLWLGPLGDQCLRDCLFTEANVGTSNAAFLPVSTSERDLFMCSPLLSIHLKFIVIVITAGRLDAHCTFVIASLLLEPVK